MSFLQAVEVWLPQGQHLPRSSAAYGEHAELAGHVGAQAAGLRLAVGLPIHGGRRLRAVVVLLA